MKLILTFSFLFFSSLSFASSEFVCANTMESSYEAVFFQEMVEKNPYCTQAVRELKKKSYEDDVRFDQVVQDEIQDIKKYFNQRTATFYGVISKEMLSIRKKGKEQKDIAPRVIRDESFDKLKSSCDKLKHCVVSCKLSYSCGFYSSRAIGRVKELVHDLILGRGEADMLDIHANEVGLAISREVVKSSSDYKEVGEKCESQCAGNILRLHTLHYEYNKKKFCR